MGFDEYSAEILKRPRTSENLIVFSSVGSTNRVGQRLLEELAPDGARPPSTLIAAWSQRAGRGRQGRSWESPAGRGVYATLVLSLPGIEALQLLPMVVGVALAEALERHCRDPVRLKWPNDLMVLSSKLGGILIETTAGAARPAAVVGFGVNYLQGAEGAPHAGATCLDRHSDGLPSLAALTLELAAAVQRKIGETADLQAAATAYRRWSAHHPGDRLRFRMAKETFAGTLLEIDDAGRLRLETDSGERIVSSGEVLEAAPGPRACRGARG